MIAVQLKLLSALVAGYMMTLSDTTITTIIGLITLIVLNIASTIKLLIDRKTDRDKAAAKELADSVKREQEHQFRMEEAENTAKVRFSIDTRLAETARGIEANRRQLVVVGKQVEAVGEKADTAYNAANHINEKIASAAQHTVGTVELVETIRDEMVSGKLKVAALSDTASAQIRQQIRHEFAQFLQQFTLLGDISKLRDESKRES